MYFRMHSNLRLRSGDGPAILALAALSLARSGPGTGPGTISVPRRTVNPLNRASLRPNSLPLPTTCLAHAALAKVRRLDRSKFDPLLPRKRR